MPFLAPALIAIGSAISAATTAIAVGVTTAALDVGVSAGVAAAIGNFTLAAVPALLETDALAGVSALLAPHPAVNNAGLPQQFKPDPNAGLPVVMGRYGVGGNLVYETTSGGGNKAAAGAKGNEYLTSFVILSALGPVQAFETLRFNDTILTWDPNGQACTGGYIPYDEVQSWNPGYRNQNADGSYINNNYQDRAWQNIQLGALNAGYFAPPNKLASDNAGLPEWTQAHGFSSFCAAALTLVYDQRYYAGGVPQYQWVLQGIKIYDPRQDSTYPGGDGGQRWAGKGASAAAITSARGSWTFSQNPWIHALNYALGFFLPNAQTGPGRLYAGIGAGVTGVDVAAFVRAANIADANGWLICGQWTTGDGKWSVLTEMAKAGSGSIVIKNGIISCIVDTPLTSLGTVTADDLSGPITLPTGTSFKARINTIFPRFTSEAHRWQMVQADTPVMAATYVAEDGEVRSQTLDWQYVPAVNQACQVAAYTICNGREINGITLPGKPKLRNYAVGDCFTLDIPEAGLATTKVMVTKRETDWSTGGVTLTVRTETDAKHAYSLGLSGVAPATPGISGYDPTILEAPLPTSWASGLLEVSDPVTGEARSIIQVTGAPSDNIYAKFVDIRWRPVAQASGVWTPTGDGSWSYTQQSASQGQYPLDLNPGSYDVQIAYTTVSGAYPSTDDQWLDLGVLTVGGSTSAATASVPGGATIGSQSPTTMDLALAALAQAQANVAQLQKDYQGTVSADQAAQQAEQYAGQAESSATNAAMSEGLATSTLSNIMPSSMTSPAVWSAGEGFPNAPYVGGDSHFVTSSSDGAAVFTNLPGAYAVCVSAGQITPKVGNTYRVTATGRIPVVAGDGIATIFQAGLLGRKSDGSLFGVYDAAPDQQHDVAGQTVTSSVVFVYDGSTPLSALKARLLMNYNPAGSTAQASACRYELLTLALEDVTESFAAAASAADAQTQAQDAATQAGYAQGYAVDTSKDAAAAAESAQLVANYNPGSNLVKNPSWGLGDAYWNLQNGFSCDPTNQSGPILGIVNGTSAAITTDQGSTSQSFNAPIVGGAPFSLQFEVDSYGGLSGGVIQLGLNWTNAAGDQHAYTVLPVTQNTGAYTRFTLENQAAPPWATLVNVYVQVGGVTLPPGAGIAVRKVKVEQNAVCTPFTDDQVGAVIADSSAAAADATSAVARRTTTLEAAVGDPKTGNEALYAGVQENAGAIAGLDGKTYAWLTEAVAASSGAPAKFQMVSGDGTSLIGLVAQVLSLSNTLGNGGTIDVLTITNGDAYFANRVFIGANIYLDPAIPGIVAINGNSQAIFGEGYGANGNMILWCGPANVTPAQASRQNAYLCIDSNGLYVEPAGNQPVKATASATISTSGNTSREVFNFTVPGIQSGGVWQASVQFGAIQSVSPTGGVTINWQLVENSSGTVVGAGSLSASSYNGEPVTVDSQTNYGYIVGNEDAGTVQLDLYVSLGASGQSITNAKVYCGVIWTP